MEQHLPVRDVASKLACSEASIRRLIRAGTLPALKLGRDYRVSESEITLALSTKGNRTNKRKK